MSLSSCGEVLRSSGWPLLPSSVCRFSYMIKDVIIQEIGGECICFAYLDWWTGTMVLGHPLVDKVNRTEARSNRLSHS